MPSQHSEPLVDTDNPLFSGVDHHQVAHLTRAFDIMADRLGGVSNSTAMWAMATMMGKILASTSMNSDLMDATGKLFAEMLRAAYPIMVRALEDVQRQQAGRPQFDA